MPAYYFKGLLQNKGWVENVTVTVDASGVITGLSPFHISDAEVVEGYAIPGFQNAHSHAFQYAMAGVAESNGGKVADNFWTWRNLMYRLSLSVTPEDIEMIATALYAEMIRQGYTNVAEFNYLHHDTKGKPYNNLAEHGERLIAAAKNTGIKITLIPIFYQKGGFHKNPEPEQRRFISATTETYFKLLESSAHAIKSYDQARLGFGIHSIRAVDTMDIVRTLAEGPADLPFHMHIAEQLLEVEDTSSYLNQRPVEWLFDHVPVNERFHLIHATHLTGAECSMLAHSGAHVVLCPSTEGNLGDGLFPFRAFQKQKGQWSIGTDSHVGLNPAEELRLLDYGQRLVSHQRNTFMTAQEKDSGSAAVKQAWVGGQKAMGNLDKNFLTIGQPLDVVVYNAKLPLLSASSLKNLLSTLIYSSDPSWILGTMINGQWKVKNQLHINKEEISTGYTEVLKKLKIR